MSTKRDESKLQIDVLDLVLRWEDGCIDDEELEALQRALFEFPEARREFVQHQLLNVALKCDADAGLPASIEPSLYEEMQKAAAARMRPISWGWLFAIAVTVLCVALGGLLINQQSTPMIAKTEPERRSQGIAMITQLVGADDSMSSWEVGDSLVPGVFEIESGVAQLEFFCGATVILEGPAKLDLKSSMFAVVHEGRLRAQVPPAARGFTLSLDEMNVVDLGTEFGVTVSQGQSTVQVFDGEVSLRATAPERSDEFELSRVLKHDVNEKRLYAGQGIRRDASGQVESTSTSPESFVDIQTLHERASTQQQARYDRWDRWSNSIRDDSRLVAYYPFSKSEASARRLKNQASHSGVKDSQTGSESLGAELDGAIVGAARVSGRWPQKDSLEFKRPGDRVRVEIPGEFSSLTLAAWVRIDSLDRRFNSLFLTDHYDHGEPHWQILENGQLYFSIRPTLGNSRDGKILSPVFWTPSMSGKWIHLATTYDAQSGQVVHYCNGQAIHHQTLLEMQRVQNARIGIASIGNWALPTHPDASFAIRNLNGSIDEFMLFSDALNNEEIDDIYQHGKP